MQKSAKFSLTAQKTTVYCLLSFKNFFEQCIKQGFQPIFLHNV